MFFRVFPGFSGFPGFFSGFFRFHPVALVEPDVLKKTRPPSDYRFKSCARLKKWPKSGQKRGKKFENLKKKKNFCENDREDVENTGLDVLDDFGPKNIFGR